MRYLYLVSIYLLAWTTVALAQDPVPPARLVITPDVDFYGSDLTPMFDTTFEACQRACLTSKDCQAMTFNSRSNACFPKTNVSDQTPYAGALSGRVIATDPAILKAAGARAAELSFLTTDDLKAATAQASAVSARFPAGDTPAAELMGNAQQAEATGNLAAAVRWAGAAVAVTDAAETWLDYARLNAAIQSDDSSQLEGYRQQVLLATINAYLRSPSAGARATALAQMAAALEGFGRARDMIPALRLAQATQPRDDTATALDDAIGKYGFRIIETQVDSDAASPRICATFSDPLNQAGVDYAPFVQLPEGGLTVDASGNQLCVDGVQHGARYQVTFRSGLPAASGEALAKPVSVALYVRDRQPSVRFPGRAYVLPATGQVSIPVVTVNATEIALKLRRVSDRNLLRSIQDGYFGRPLAPWQEDIFAADVAEDLWTGMGDVGNELNQDMTTRLPLTDVLGALPAGIYALQAQIPGADPYETSPATQWFVVSDLGLTTLSGTDGLHVFVRSLATAEVKSGVTVSLLSRANVVLGTTATDAQGYARFDAGLTRGSGGVAPALVTVQDGAADMAFLSLTDPEFDLTDRGVEGRAPTGPIDTFLTTDRGAYRAGETINATVLTRAATATAIEGLPLTAVLLRPDGVEYTRLVAQDIGAGGHVFALSVAPTAPRGTWRLNIFADTAAPPLATETVLVEDFLPERIDFTLALPDGTIRATDNPTLSVTARYLFGTPAADLAIEGEIRLAAATTLPAFPGYVFGRYDQPFESRLTALDAGLRTDAQGNAAIPLQFPDSADASQPIEATVTLRIAEGSGRPVERRLTRAIAPAGPVIGIRPDFTDVLPENAEASFRLLALDDQQKPTQMQVRWTINRVETRYQWYQLYGNWNWEPVTTRARIASGAATLGDQPTVITAPVTWGQFEVKVERTDGDYVASSTDFYAGWYAAADASTTPDTLEVSLDKAAYLPGETAHLRVVPRFAGKALITVVSNQLIDMKAVDVSEGSNPIDLPVTDEWGAGAYITATVIRPMNVAAGQNPSRALGLSYAPVDPASHRLNVKLETVSEPQPRAPLDVAIRVEGIAPGETAYATIAAVDVGILNLTAFDAPDPAAYYFGQRRLGIGIRDIYGRLIDGMNGAMGAVRSGGDAVAQIRMESPPPTEDLVAFFAGSVTVGPDGLAHASFDMPAFNGTVRLMAVVWSKSGVGQASTDVLVRDPVVVTAALPRFLAPGDRATLRLDITHATGPIGRAELALMADGVTLDTSVTPSGLDLTEGGTVHLSVPVIAGDPGSHTITVRLTTPDGKVLEKALTLPVQVNDPEVARTSRFDLAAGDTFTFDSDVFAGLIPGTGSATLAIGSLARFDTPGLLNALDRYPYGCTEQVTSAALPLLYLDQVAVAMNLGTHEGLAKRLDDSITAVLANQSANGSFGLWRPDSGDLWLDAYVSDFLSRARTQGRAVPDTAFRMAIDNLRNGVNYAADFDEGGEAIAYALYVLAREGAASIGDLRYYADVKGGAFATPLAAAQIGAALASYGDPTRAEAMFGRAAQLLSKRMADETTQVWRSDYGTNLRDAAAVLTLAVESGSAEIDREALVQRIGQSVARYRSTQEQVWSLLAANAMIGDGAAAGILVDDLPATGPLVHLLHDSVGPAPVKFTNAAATDTVLTLSSYGVPSEPEPAGGNGYAIERQYFTTDGQPLSIDNVTVGTRLVAVLTVQPFGDGEARLMVNDPLPAGFEIDNPNILRGGDIRAFDWLDLNATPERVEFRQDRFLAAVDWTSSDAFRLAYVVRAISPGDFHHPAASVEDMYRPQFRARTEVGQIRVSE